jgi:hypothetical protein
LPLALKKKISVALTIGIVFAMSRPLPTQRAAGRNAISGSLAGSSLTQSHRGAPISIEERNTQGNNTNQTAAGDTPNPGQVLVPIDVTMMSMAMVQSDAGTGAAVKEAVKKKLFPLIKFITTNSALDFHTTKGICALILHECKVTSNQREWWYHWKSMVKTSLTNHRNNRIKAIKKYYIGKFLSLSICLFETFHHSPPALITHSIH